MSQGNSEQDFNAALKGKKIPILVLDQKWHQLFSDRGKPKVIAELEETVNKHLARQGHLTQELKELKKLKKNLMSSIVENMDGTNTKESLKSKKLTENKRLISEINDKMDACEDELLDIPELLKKSNNELMNESMRYFYKRLHINAKDINDIGQWISTVRKELKKNIVRKQNAEYKNKEIYYYMHDIFGPQVIDIFDMGFEEYKEKQKEEANPKENENLEKKEYPKKQDREEASKNEEQ